MGDGKSRTRIEAYLRETRRFCTKREEGPTEKEGTLKERIEF